MTIHSALTQKLFAAGSGPGSAWPDPDKERAQPGDILGIERGGETTSLGDTEEDEDGRRRDAEREAPKD
jgi:hypothetical protein